MLLILKKKSEGGVQNIPRGGILMSKRWKSLKMVLVPTLVAVMMLGWVAFVGAEVVTITFGTDTKSGPSGFEFRQEKIVEVFEARNPEIKVKMQQFVGDFREKVTMQMVAGTAPDVMTTWGAPIIKWMDGGQLLSLEEYFGEEYLKDFPPGQLDLYGRGADGVLYTIPTMGGPQQALYYNKDMFDKAGVSYPDDSWDWNSLFEAAKKLTNRTSKPAEFGYQVPGYLNWNLCFFIWQSGGNIAPKGERRATVILLDQPEALEAMEFVHDMVWKYKVAPTPAEMGDLYAWDSFLFGKVAMQLNGVGDLKFNWEGADFEWDIARLPKGPVTRANNGGLDSVFVYQGTKHPEEAIKFLEFYASAEIQEMFIREESVIPARQSVLPKWAEISEFADRLNLKSIVADAPYMRDYPVFTDDAKVNELLNPMIDQIFGLNKVSVREGIIEVVKKINAALARAE